MAKKKKKVTLGSFGVSGVKSSAGKINEEVLLPLKNLPNRIQIYDQMYLNDSIIAGMINALEALMLKSEWSIKPFSKKARHLKEAQLAEKCVFKQKYSFSLSLYEAISSMIYGFSILEIIYKKDAETGYYIWDDLAPRSQSTVFKWLFDDNGNVTGVQQRDPNNFKFINIPVDKILHFAPRTRKRNPEGISLLRHCYLSWVYKSKIQELEAIRIEKDVRGVPTALAPAEFLDTKNEEMHEIQSMLKELVTNLSLNQDAGIVFPSDEGWKIELLKGGSSGIQDTNIIVERHNRDIGVSLLSDFVMLGKGASGSLADTKVKVFSSFVTSLMDHIQNVYNDGLKRVWEINGLNVDEMPKLVHSNLEELETMMSALILQSAHKLGLITPSVELENYIKKTYLGKDTPLTTEDEWQQAKKERLATNGMQENSDGEIEMMPDPNSKPSQDSEGN